MRFQTKRGQPCGQPRRGRFCYGRLGGVQKESGIAFDLPDLVGEADKLLHRGADILLRGSIHKIDIEQHGGVHCLVPFLMGG